MAGGGRVVEAVREGEGSAVEGEGSAVEVAEAVNIGFCWIFGLAPDLLALRSGQEAA